MLPLSGYLSPHRQSWTRGFRQIDETKQNIFIFSIFLQLLFCEILPKASKLGFWVVGCVLAIILTLKSFDNSWGSSFIHFLTTRSFYVSLVVKRNCVKTWKSLQMFWTRLYSRFSCNLVITAFSFKTITKLGGSSEDQSINPFEHYFIAKEFWTSMLCEVKALIVLLKVYEHFQKRITSRVPYW